MGRGRELAVVAAGALVLAGCGGGGAPKLVSIGAGLDGPEGFRASVYARGLPLVSAFAWDGNGGLWATASGSETHGRDGLFRVARAGATPLKVASLRGPLGLVWIGPQLYVSSLGRVTVFSGFDGTRFASRRTVLVGPKGGGENNNLVRAPNGELVLGVSASCDHCRPPTKWSGAVVAFHPDGSGLHLVARRVRAPYGLVYHDGRLYATVNQRDDLGAKTPGDFVTVVRSGEDFRFPGCWNQGGAACEGVPAPLAVLDPHAAAGGIAFLGDTAYVAEWSLGKVLRVSRGGAVTPFLTGLRNPLPLATLGDSLLVGDWETGTIYRIAPG